MIGCVELMPHESDSIKWAYWCHKCKKYIRGRGKYGTKGAIISQNDSHQNGNWKRIINHAKKHIHKGAA